ncbi:hypothetical protein Pint_08510 [Pistacia integerrima]|uniref:Uncharacterized protein n=1 Tax=Pistacia integerrima TaxID=434235 RepID=A0ACC0XVV9_9ROSI|nr:hypothetical protein Pint_08510 [Pistacia integerrima]
MPRRSAGGRSASRLRSVARAPVHNAPQPAARAPPPPPMQSGNGSIGGGFGAAVADGLAFGTSTTVAHRAVDVVMGPHVIHTETVSSSASAMCTQLKTARQDRHLTPA